MSVPEDGHSANIEWIHPHGPCGIEDVYRTFMTNLSNVQQRFARVDVMRIPFGG